MRPCVCAYERADRGAKNAKGVLEKEFNAYPRDCLIKKALARIDPDGKRTREKAFKKAKYVYSVKGPRSAACNYVCAWNKHMHMCACMDACV